MFSTLLLIQFTYGVLFTLMYILTVAILVANWKLFDVYFFKLYVYQFFFNMWMYWNFYITWRLPASTCADCPLSSWFLSMSHNSSSSFPFFFFMFLHYHFGFINYTNALMTSFNRWTMIFMTKNYAQIWHYGTYLIIIAFIVIPFYFTYPLLGSPAYFEYNPSSDTFVARTTGELSQIYSILIVWMVLTTTANVALNVACWFRISKYSQIARQKSDYRLFLVSFVTFLIQCIAFSLGVLNKISTDTDPSKC